MDLADEAKTKALLKEHTESTNTKVLFTNNRSGTRESSQSIKKVMSILRHMAAEQRSLRNVDQEEEENQGKDEKAFRTIVYGLPNVGKSSFINSARQKYTKGRGKKPTPVGKNPGMTKSVLSNIIICDSPKIMILDTPGIVPPNLNDPLVGIKLALVETFADHKIGEEVMADFLLYTLNKQNNASYVEMCGLDEPSDDFEHVIASLASKQGLIRGGAPDIRFSSMKLLSWFRDGKFGRITLD